MKKALIIIGSIIGSIAIIGTVALTWISSTIDKGLHNIDFSFDGN